MSAVDISSHIHRDAEGRAWIDDTNTKVIEVALDHIAYGWSADEIHVHVIASFMGLPLMAQRA
ncbi:MAG TPA: hypothetical protein VH619_16230 [Verrucomicrobiae bacterium]|jgi:hypothetical protein|nr:hypothetical protein [Verrucomicrobiae bacterium]